MGLYIRPDMLRRRHTGFTLLELLVVLVLASIAISVVGVGSQSIMDRSKYHQALREVRSLLNAGHAKAVQDGHEVIVAFNPAARELAIEGYRSIQVPSVLAVEWEAVTHSPVQSHVGFLPLFVFNADGSGYGGRFSVLRGGRGVAFRLNWLLGTVEQAETLAKS
jgi:general secretion pathway protein H